MVERATGVGFRVPAPVSSAQLRMHLHMMHGVYLESWVTDESMAEAHGLAHGAERGHRWCTHVAHRHAAAPPPTPPAPERTWW